MKKGFEVSYTIGYFEVDGDLFLTPSSLAVYLQDAAILHSDSIGYTIDYFNNEKKGWVIINWHIDIIRMPQKGETIRVCTWSDECKRMQAERSFVVYDENEIPVAKVVTICKADSKSKGNDVISPLISVKTTFKAEVVS